MMNYNMKDYGWTKPKTHAHTYLLGSIKKILNNLSISKNAKILDAGCGRGGT